MGISLKVTTDTVSGNDYSWLANRKGLDTCRSITVDLSLFIAVHSADGKIPSGTVLGLVTATNKYGPYDNTMVNGLETARGHLLQDIGVTDGWGNSLTESAAALFWEGIVIESRLPAFAATVKGEIDAAGKLELPHIRYEA